VEIPAAGDQSRSEKAQVGHESGPQASQPLAVGHPRSGLLKTARVASTIVIALAATFIGYTTWQYYVTTPWTRNGAVRVQVANVAPQVSGQIVDLRVVDNQFVHKGDVLYVVDPADYRIARDLSKAQLDQLSADLEVKKAQFERREHLTLLATTPEEQQIYKGAALQAQAAYHVGEHQLSEAELKLSRTQVISPVNGYVTNLLLRSGDFAVAGQSNVAIVDADSFWIDGYFEETKMSQICVGDPAEAKLIGYDQPIVGHVKTITRGISVANAELGVQGLPNVNPIYTWVRLAQRVPVRIGIDSVPPGIPLVSGLTATVVVRPPHASPDERRLASLGDRLSRLGHILEQSAERSDCATKLAASRG
jgi:multidrug resistance efflux pump